MGSGWWLVVSLAMMFNTLTFMVFLPVAFLLGRFACGQDARGQSALLVVAEGGFVYGSLTLKQVLDGCFGCNKLN